MVLQLPQTKSILEGQNGRDLTSVALSTNIVIMVANNEIGAIQTLSINEDRAIQMINEIGYDGHIDSAPISSTNITGTCNRVRFNALRMTNAFSRDFLHVHSQRIPFDIVVIDKWQGDNENAVITTIKNVWIKQLSYEYKADNFLIFDNMNWEAEAISSTLNNGNAATGGMRGLTLQLDDNELASDVGKNRGALSAPGLITDFFSNA